MGDLANWTSHKVVKAGKLISLDTEYHAELMRSIFTATVQDASGAPTKMDCPTGMFARGIPAPGDYIVIYDDGYKSWSPAKAFEDGYTRS